MPLHAPEAIDAPRRTNARQRAKPHSMLRPWAVGAMLMLGGMTAHAQAPAVFAIHIGVNVAPPESPLRPLNYADDDAVRFHRFTQTFTDQSWLLAVLDAPTARRHSDLVGTTRAPHRRGIETVLDELDAHLAEAQAAGRATKVLLTFSGHGVVGAGGVGLALLDGALDRSFLENKIAALHADEVHLFLDACHAEGIVGGRSVILRESQTTRLEVDPQVTAQLFEDDFFARHPHVGAVLASSAAQETHEWSRLQGGVFTHEVLSALRGPADVNQDGKVAYSELAAFVAAANRAVKNQHAVPTLITRPPRLNPGAFLVDLETLGDTVFLVGDKTPLGHFYIERDDGLRVLDAHLDADAPFALALPANERLWIRTDAREAPLRAHASETVYVADLDFGPLQSGARGSVAAALHAGLFSAPYGRAYYTGWVDSQGLLAVDLGASKPVAPPSTTTESLQGPAALSENPGGEAGVSWPAITTLSLLVCAGGAAGLTAAALAGMAAAYMQFQATDLEAPAADAADLFYLMQAGAIFVGALTLGLGVSAAGAAVWWLAAE